MNAYVTHNSLLDSGRLDTLWRSPAFIIKSRRIWTAMGPDIPQRFILAHYWQIALRLYNNDRAGQWLRKT